MESIEPRRQGNRMKDQTAGMYDKRSLAGSREIIAASGISLRLWRLYAYFWLVCLIFPVLSLVRTPLEPIRLFFALGGLAVFTSSYFWVMWPHPLSASAFIGNRLRRSLVLPVMLTVLALLLSLGYGSAFCWLFVGVSAVTGIMLTPQRAFWTIMALTLLTLAVSVGVGGGIASTDW